MPNDVAYAVFNLVLFLLYVWLEVRQRYLTMPPSNGAAVTIGMVVNRTEQTVGYFHGTFITLAGLNVAIAQIVVPDLDRSIREWSFLLLLTQTAILARLIYKNIVVRGAITRMIGGATAEIERHR